MAESVKWFEEGHSYFLYLAWNDAHNHWNFQGTHLTAFDVDTVSPVWPEATTLGQRAAKMDKAELMEALRDSGMAARTKSRQ